MQGSTIGALWRRFLAFAIDCLILNVIGRAVGYAFFDAISRLGPWARLLGFCLTLAYFATLESSVGGGQTLGKRLLGLRVVNIHGGLIEWKRAATRCAIYIAPYFLTGPRYTADIATWIVTALITFIELGVGGASLYLLIFNRHSRQGLHDVATGTYVVNSNPSGPLTIEPIWRRHWSVIGAFLLLIVFAELSKGVSVASLPRSGYVNQNLVDELFVERLAEVQAADVRIWIPIPLSNSALGHFFPKKQPFTIVVQEAGEIRMREALADQVAAILLKCDPRAQKQDLIRVEIGRNYNLGITSGNDYQSFTHTPAEWSHSQTVGSGIRDAD